MTETRAIELGYSDFEIAYGFLTGEIIPDRDHLTPTEKEHGKCIDYIQNAYHDVYVYEDGYEEYRYIGD